MFFLIGLGIPSMVIIWNSQGCINLGLTLLQFITLGRWLFPHVRAKCRAKWPLFGRFMLFDNRLPHPANGCSSFSQKKVFFLGYTSFSDTPISMAFWPIFFFIHKTLGYMGKWLASNKFYKLMQVFRAARVITNKWSFLWLRSPSISGMDTQWLRLSLDYFEIPPSKIEFIWIHVSESLFFFSDSPPARWGSLDLIRVTSLLPSFLPLTANSRSQRAPPDLNYELQMSVGTAGPQPRAPTEIWRLRLRSGNAHVRENVRIDAK